jgi:hypothetical protein
MRLEEIDLALAKTLHRAKRTPMQPALKPAPANQQGQPILPQHNIPGTGPLAGAQTVQGVSADFPVPSLTSLA